MTFSATVTDIYRIIFYSRTTGFVWLDFLGKAVVHQQPGLEVLARTVVAIAYALVAAVTGP